MSGQGRPFRFLGVLTALWVVGRIALLWPQAGSLGGAIEALVPLAAAAPPPATMPTAKPVASMTSPSPRSIHPRVLPGHGGSMVGSGEQVQIALLAMLQFGPAEPRNPRLAPAPEPHLPLADRSPQVAPALSAPVPLDRWSLAAWAVARPGRGIGAAPGGGQIGGSQLGLRLAYSLVPHARLAGFARVSTPLHGTGREAAIGADWQPVARIPVRVIAEQRFGLDGNSGGPGAGVIAGIDRRVPANFRLEAYGQAGAVHRERWEPYADGAARATRLVAAHGGITLSLGAGVWGAAQRDAARLDIGPSAVLALPVSGTTLRLSFDWRQRVAGDAKPGSGPALTLGGDF